MNKLLNKKVILALLALVSAVLGTYFSPELVTALSNVADAAFSSHVNVESADAGAGQ